MLAVTMLKVRVLAVTMLTVTVLAVTMPIVKVMSVTMLTRGQHNYSQIIVFLSSPSMMDFCNCPLLVV